MYVVFRPKRPDIYAKVSGGEVERSCGIDINTGIS